MKFPINLFLKLNKFVDALDEKGCYSSRNLAIRETALLLLSIAHDEYYDVVNAFDKKYDNIADVCRKFVEG